MKATSPQAMNSGGFPYYKPSISLGSGTVFQLRKDKKIQVLVWQFSS